jgi:hypothetical protein
MKLKDYIARLQAYDPTGEAEIVQFAAKDGYHSDPVMAKTELALNAQRTSGYPGAPAADGAHLDYHVYRERFPYGRKKPTPAILVSFW